MTYIVEAEVPKMKKKMKKLLTGLTAGLNGQGGKAACKSVVCGKTSDREKGLYN